MIEQTEFFALFGRRLRVASHQTGVVALLWILLMGCTSTPTSPRPTEGHASSATAGTPRTYSLGKFPELPSTPLPDRVATSMQEILDTVVEDGRLLGVTATVIVADVGTWSGAAGTADGVTDMVPEAQFNTGSTNKTVIAAQVLRLIEDGMLALDDRVADHLPPTLDFDTNGATIRQLLSMRSGIANADLQPFVHELGYDRRWIPLHPNHEQRAERYLETLETLPTPKDSPPGRKFDYSSTNFQLLELMIEHVTGRPSAEVLRADVLSGPGLERMIWQPAEHPSDPVAAPLSRRYTADVSAAFEAGGGYLPSRFDGWSAIVSDSPSLARWAYQLFGGGLLKAESLAAMSRGGRDGYGLGLWNDTREWDAGTEVLSGSGIIIPAYSSIFVVLPDEGIVVVAQSNVADSFRDFGQVEWCVRHLADAARRL
jgi:D-alanyl-D-alanine carboxypeptidase